MTRQTFSKAIVIVSLVAMDASVAIGQDSYQWRGGPPGLNGEVHAWTTWDPDGPSGPKPAVLIVGGSFTRAGDVPAYNIAAWDGNSWHALGGGVQSTTSTGVYALITYDGDLVAAGQFTAAGGVECSNIARWDGNGWHPLGAGIVGYPSAMTTYGGTLVVAGAFGTAGGMTCGSIAAWDGTSWSALRGGLYTSGVLRLYEGSVTALAVYNGDLLVAGAFQYAGVPPSFDCTFNIPYLGIARWDGTTWSVFEDRFVYWNVFTLPGYENWQPDYQASIHALAVHDGDLVVAGSIRAIGAPLLSQDPDAGVRCNGIAGWDGSSWYTFGSGMFASGYGYDGDLGWVYALSTYGADLVAGGLFDIAGGVRCKSIARWDGAWHPLGSGVAGWANHLTVYGEDLFSTGKCAGHRSYETFTTWGPANGPHTDSDGDGVLNAPYRGTITSLREACVDAPYGEIRNHVEPECIDWSTIDTTAGLSIWVDLGAGSLPWDRSVLRLYRGHDASGDEIDLTDHINEESAYSLPSPGAYERFSFKAVGTKTLGVQAFKISFKYKVTDDTESAVVTRAFRVAPVTGSFMSLPGQSESFHYGTPILDVSVGAARLTVPIGCEADQIGAAHMASGFIGTYNAAIQINSMLFAGGAESVYVPTDPQYELNESHYQKANWGTPWAGHFTGYHSEYGTSSQSAYGPDGTEHKMGQAKANRTDTMWQPLKSIKPRGDGGAVEQTYTYDDTGYRVTGIHDGLGNAVALTRDPNTGRVTYISTSDGRGWTILSDAESGNITGVVSSSGLGARYYSWNAPLDRGGRVTEVRINETPGQGVLYAYAYYDDGDLKEEWRWVDGALRKVVEHVREAENRVRKDYVDATHCRKTKLEYDPDPSFKNRLASISTYSGLDGTGTEYKTIYTHDKDNPRGNMVVTQVQLPDGTLIDHEYDYEYGVGLPTGANRNRFGFLTKTTQTKNGNSQVTFDAEYEFFYNDAGTTKLYYSPRMVKRRDGRGASSEFDTTVTYQYGDAVHNQLLSKSGPVIKAGTSLERTPLVEYAYDPSTRLLSGVKTHYGSGATDYREVSYEYDSLGRLYSQTVGTSVTGYRYEDGLSTQDRTVIDPDGYYTKTTYDTDGRVKKVQRFLVAGSASGNYYQTENFYDSLGRLDHSVTDNKDQDGASLAPATITTQFNIDPIGRLLGKTVDTSGLGRESHFTYNYQNDVTSETDTSGRGVKREYDGRGLLSAETVLAAGGTPDTNLVTTYQYDLSRGYLEYVFSPTGQTTQKIYDVFGRVQQELSIPGAGGGNTITTTYEHDAAGNVTRTYVDDGAVHLSDTKALYDEGGFNYETRQRLVFGNDTNPPPPEQPDPNVHPDPVTQRKFDWAGNVIEERSPGDATVGDRVLTTHYDGAGRVDYVDDSDGGHTDFIRDKRGHVTKQTVALTATASAVTDTEYDALGRAVKVTDPADQYWLRHYTARKYDSFGNLLRETAFDAANNALMTTVSKLDRSTRTLRTGVLRDASSTTTDPEPTTDRVVDKSFDADGRLLTESTYNNNAATALTTYTAYDANGRVDWVTDSWGLAYTQNYYEDNGRLQSRETSDGAIPTQVAYLYDGQGRVKMETLRGFSAGPDLWTSYSYNGSGQPHVDVTNQREILNVTTRTVFDLAGRQTALIEDADGPLERPTSFTHNRLSQTTSQTASNKSGINSSFLGFQTTSYRYTTLGLPVRIIYPDGGESSDGSTCTGCIQMTYDLAGRMTSRTDQLGRSTVYVRDPRGLLLSSTTGNAWDSYEYSALGQMTAANRGTPAPVSRTEFNYTFDYFTESSSNLGYLLSETQFLADGPEEGRTVYYSCDQAGNRTAMTTPAETWLAYVPTACNKVSLIYLNDLNFVSYGYYASEGVVQSRSVSTTDVEHASVYQTLFGYDYARRNGTVGTFKSVDGQSTEVASFATQFDLGNNPSSQLVTGMAGFAGNNRTFQTDRLDRLTNTFYAATSQNESVTLDLLGNRQQSSGRRGETTTYTLAPNGGGLSNQYGAINGHPVVYDAVGNLIVDEDGRRYSYDEQNRLIEVRPPAPAPPAEDTVILASYAYDALGRRIASTIGDTTTRYYHDGQNVIEERNAAEELVREHFHGAQYIDERIATRDLTKPEAEQFTYYLPRENFSIAATANADGSAIMPLDYTSTGNWDAVNTDFNHDGYVDGQDVLHLQGCLTGPAQGPPAAGCTDADLDADGDVDPADFAVLQGCMAGAYVPPSPSCVGPKSGTFAMHGQPLDVLPDGHVLMYSRARTYDVKHGRWLQRDPLGYVDGGNLYEAYSGNPLVQMDPQGTEPERRYWTNLTWDGAVGTVQIVVYDDGGYFGSSRVIQDFNFTMREDWRDPKMARTRAWVTFGSYDFLVNVRGFHEWLNSLDGQLHVLSAGDPSLGFILGELTDSFAATFGNQIQGIRDHQSGRYLRGFNPDVGETVGARAAELQAGIAKANEMIREGMTEEYHAMLGAVGAEVVGAGVRIVRSGSGGGGTGAPRRGGGTPEQPPGGGSGGGGKGPYGEVGGHHVHAKAAFRGNVNYDPDEGFAVSQEYMQQRGWRHTRFTAMQRKLFREFAQSGQPNTLREHSRIAVEALKAGGATETEARSLVAESLRNLRQQGVRVPTDIPWAPQ